MKQLSYLLMMLTIGLLTTPMLAQDAATTVTTYGTPAVAAEEPTEEETPAFDISGAVDAYYMYGFNGTGLPTSFTDQEGAFALGMGNVIFSKEGKVGFVADLAFGPRAEAANGTGEGPTLAAIKQLYVTYSPSDVVTFTAGNFSTFVGYELIDATGNINYSTSYLFSNGPFYHTGVKVDVALGDNFGAMLGVFNDTDAKYDVVPGKHFGAQLSSEVGGLSAYLNFLYGKEEDDEDDKLDVNEYELDLTATYEVSDLLGLGLNVATYKTSVDGTNTGGFTGAAIYATINATENFALGLRAEQFAFQYDSDTVEDDNVTALTASGNITIGNLRLIPEVRVDFSDNDDFFSTDEETFKKSTGGLFLAAVYSF